ncbi:MAG: glycosyltransferase family 4 protein [Phycisphaerales bacterium]|nr:glycosyltransferase family 4 protein [Phycisphaerales bacterium]
MRICHVITRLIIGGAQENTLLTCEGLHALGHDVTLISGPTTGPEGSLRERAIAGGYAFIEVPELVRAVNPWLDARAVRELRRHYSILKPDIVHTHSSKAGIVGREAAFVARVPIVVHTIHGQGFNRTQPAPIRALYAFLERRAGKRTHRIIGVAQAMIDQALAAGIGRPERMRVVYSGMDVGCFTPNKAARAAARAAWGVRSDEEVVIGSVARLFRRKGYEQLIPIMSQVAAARPNARFVWVGDGAQRGDYEAELKRLGLRDRTTLVGLVRPDEVPAQIAGFDILAHASQWEGLPRVAPQALLLRVPVVAFDIDGTPEVVIPGQTGRLAALNDLDAFSRALIDLFDDPRERARLGAAGRERCLEQFDARQMVSQLDAIYREVAAERRLGR